MPVRDYKELEVWKKGLDLVDAVFAATRALPKEQRFVLASHLQRTAISIPSNIAEGFDRHHTKEFVQHLHIALGSCAELETQVIIAYRQAFLSKEEYEGFSIMLVQERRMINKLIQVLRQRTERLR